MKKVFTFLFAMLLAQAVFAQPSIQEEFPAVGSSLNRYVPVTISFKVYGVAFYGSTPLLGYAQNISLSNITITAGATTLPVTFACSGGSCSYTFTPNTNASSVSVSIAGTADMQYLMGDMTNTAVTLAPYTQNYVISGPLSVEMLSFEAKSPKSGIVNLNWETASEKDNDRFEVERSLNGKDFEKISEVKGHGTSDVENQYTFTDNQKPEGRIVYYRLNIVDINGDGHYSKTVVAYDKKGKLDIKSANEKVINFEAASNGEVEMSIYNMNGQAVSSQKVEATEGYNSVEINTSSLASGLYILHVTDGRERKTVKIFKS